MSIIQILECDFCGASVLHGTASEVYRLRKGKKEGKDICAQCLVDYVRKEGYI